MAPHRFSGDWWNSINPRLVVKGVDPKVKELQERLILIIRVDTKVKEEQERLILIISIPVPPYIIVQEGALSVGELHTLYSERCQRQSKVLDLSFYGIIVVILFLHIVVIYMSSTFY